MSAARKSRMSVVAALAGLGPWVVACGSSSSGGAEAAGGEETAASGDDGGGTPTAGGDGSTSTDGTRGDGPDADSSASSTGAPDDPLPDPPETESALGMLAASMRPGEWAELQTDGLGDGSLFQSDNDGGSITEFTNEAVWDPIGRRIYVIGTARGDSASYGPQNQIWVDYDVASNAWSRRTSPPFYIGFHSYDHAALDTTNGDYFVRVVHEPTVQRYRPATDEWQALPTLPTYGGDCCDLLEYFPEMGGLVFVEFNSVLEIARYTAGGWQTLTTPADASMGTFHLAGEYSAPHSVLFFGGGQTYPYDPEFGNEVYTLDADGGVTRIADAPDNFDVANALTVVDPNGGNLLIFPSSAPSEFWEYDMGGDAWQTRTIDAEFSIVNAYDDKVTVATGIPGYGVIAFIKHDHPDGPNTGVTLYRHS